MAKAKILVVDNDADFRISLARDVLGQQRYEVFEASNIQQALEILSEGLIHLAIIDIRLTNDDDPNDQSGLQLSAQIDQTVAKVLLTAYPPLELTPAGFPSKVQIPRSGTSAEDVYLVTKQDGPERLLAAVSKSLEERFEIIPSQRIAVLTSGGESPGTNAAVWAIVRTAMNNNIEVIGVQEGYRGLVDDLTYKMKWNHVSDILILGGTILGTDRFEQFKDPTVRAKAVENIRRKQVSGLIVIGGDSSMQGATVLAGDLAKLGVPLQTVAIPETIDNDIWGTDMSLGAASASNALAEVLRNMIKPAQALRRVFVCEVMGRYSGYLALAAALGIGADAVLIPEQVVEVRASQGSVVLDSLEDRIDRGKTENNLRSELDKVAKTLEAVFATGKRYGFVILAEGIGLLSKDKLNGKYVRDYLEDRIQDWDSSIRPDVRDQVLSHPVRGVAPSRFDVWLGAELGAAAVQCLLKGKTEVMVGWSEEKGVIETPFREVIAKSNLPPQDKWQDRPKWQELLELQQATTCPPSLSEQLRARGNRFVVSPTPSE